MNISKTLIAILMILSLLGMATRASAQDDPPVDDPVLRALADELARSMTLELEDLGRPYFVEYAVDDTDSLTISASYGAVVSSDQNRSRRLRSHVRVGSYQLDNTNFSGGGGGGMGGRARRGGGGGRGAGDTALPIEDNYTAIRQAIWSATDDAYKAAVQQFTEKQAYMADRETSGRPDDFSQEEPLLVIEPRMEQSFDAPLWEKNLRAISARFLESGKITEADVDLRVSATNNYLVNSEGTRQRTGLSRTLLAVSASGLTADGERLSDEEQFFAFAPEQLPTLEELLSSVDALIQRLEATLDAPTLDNYTGPVLIDSLAAAQMFHALLASGLGGMPEPVGAGRRRAARGESLDRLLGRRILPRFMQVYDDPRAELFDGTLLAGSYKVDDQGVLAQRISIVEEGKLVGMAMSRAPTGEFSGSNGHGRGRRGMPEATAGCLYVEASKGQPEAALKEALIELAADQGLTFGIRISSLRGDTSGGAEEGMRAAFMRRQQGGGGGPTLPDPILIHKVFVEDGREERVRSGEFGDFDVGRLKEILIAGDSRTVLNQFGLLGSGVPQSVIAPAVLYEELDLYRIEQEQVRKPILEAPGSRR
ncbi:MAG: metallopeptidase TldD-related protein [Planctomycetota bacterium]